MKTKKIIAIILCAALLVSTAITSYAVEEEDYGIMPCYELISSCNASISTSGTTITASSKVIVFGSYTVKIKITIETSQDNRNWTTYKSFPIETVTGSSTRTLSKKAYSAPAGYYRTVAEITVISGSVVEDEIAYSSSKRII